MRSRLLLLCVLMCLGAVLGSGIILALMPFSAASFALYRWAPLPVACAGLSCVTYREWATSVDDPQSASSLLTTLLEEHALVMVAQQEGVRVTDEEVSQAVSAAKSILKEDGGDTVLQDLYRTTPDVVFRLRLKRLLLREKLRAQDISSPWDVPNAPHVTLWNIHLQWSAGEREVQQSIKQSS